MIKVVSSVAYPSKTIPGRSQSTYVSTPIPDPTPSKLLKVLQEHFNSINHHIRLSNAEGLVVKISVE